MFFLITFYSSLLGTCPDFDKTVEYVLSELKSQGLDTERIDNDIKEIHATICQVKLVKLGNRVLPPKAY